MDIQEYAPEQRLKAILDALPDLVFRVARDGTVLACHGAPQLPGLPLARDLVGARLCEIAPPEFAEETLVRFGPAFATGEAQVHEVQLASGGATRDFEVRLVASGADEALVVVRDITERKRAETELHGILDRISECVWSIEVAAGGDIQHLYYSPGIAKLTGRPAEHFTSHARYLEVVHFDDRERVRQSAARMFRGESGPLKEEYRVVWPDGSVHWIRTSIVATRLPDGRTRMDGVDAEITEHRELEEQLRQSQKMEAVGRLAGGVAHDFNNLLTVLTGYAYMVLEDVSTEGPGRAGIEEILKCVERASALTKRLLAFSKRQAPQPRELDLNALVRGMEGMLRRVLGDDVELETSLCAPAALVVADPHQVEQAVMNLIVNSRDAMPDGGRIAIETAITDVAEPAEAGMRVPPGRFVRLSVSDTGQGMDEETRRRALEPFFTTKAEGTGLGLSTLHGIVRQAGGTVSIDSAPDQGTRIDIYLPATRPAGPA